MSGALRCACCMSLIFAFFLERGSCARSSQDNHDSLKSARKRPHPAGFDQLGLFFLQCPGLFALFLSLVAIGIEALIARLPKIRIGGFLRWAQCGKAWPVKLLHVGHDDVANDFFGDSEAAEPRDVFLVVF